MPPSVASAPGSSGNIRPLDRRCFSSCFRVTPASTVTSRSSAFRRTMRFMRVRSTLMPPWTGITCPSSDDPAPNGVIGQRCSAQAATIACTSSVEVGNTTASGATAVVMRFAAAMVVADGGAGGHAVAEQIAQPRQQRLGRHLPAADLLDQVLGERQAHGAGRRRRCGTGRASARSRSVQCSVLSACSTLRARAPGESPARSTPGILLAWAAFWTRALSSWRRALSSSSASTMVRSGRCRRAPGSRARCARRSACRRASARAGRRDRG